LVTKSAVKDNTKSWSLLLEMKSKEEERVPCSTTTTWGALTLIILFSKMLKFSEILLQNFKRKIKRKKNLNLQEYFTL